MLGERRAAPPAPPPIDPKAVVATVGGEQITEADLGFAAEELGQQLQQIPPDQVRAVLLAQVIDTQAHGAGRPRRQSSTRPTTTSCASPTSQDRALRRAYTEQQSPPP